MNPSSLTRAVEWYRSALPPGQLLEFSLTPLDRLDVPVHTVTFLPGPTADDPNLSGSIYGGIGYGETLEAARVGAYGELTEDVSSGIAVSHLPRVAHSYREMVAKHGDQAVIDPVTLCLEAGIDYAPDTVLDWVQIRRLATGDPVFIPLEFVASAGSDAPPRAGVSRLATPITNGHGAGTTLEMAQAHGLLELLQRDGNSVQYRALADAVAIDPDTISDPVARTLLARYDQAGIEVIIKIAATDFGCVNLYAVGYDRSENLGGLPVMAAACGEAVHPVADVALRKALLEFASSRARLALFHGPLDFVRRVTPPGYLDAYQGTAAPAREEPLGLAGMRHWLTLGWNEMKQVLAPVFAVRARTSFADLPTSSDPTLAADKTAGLRHVAARLAEEGLDVFYADLSRPDTGVYAVKMIVPGLEVETMSYRRIGERNLRRLLKRQEAEPGFPTLAGLGKPPAGALSIPLTAAARRRLGATGAWFDGDKHAAVMRNLYVLYREPSRHVTAFSLLD